MPGSAIDHGRVDHVVLTYQADVVRRLLLNAAGSLITHDATAMAGGT
jgi:hypothetical protein